MCVGIQIRRVDANNIVWEQLENADYRMPDRGRAEVSGGDVVLYRMNGSTKEAVARLIGFAIPRSGHKGGGDFDFIMPKGYPHPGSRCLAIGMIVITGLRHLDRRMKRQRQATLIVAVPKGGPGEEEMRAGLLAEAYKLDALSLVAASTLAGWLENGAPGATRTPPPDSNTSGKNHDSARR